MADKYKPVVFEDSRGNTISNDPVYHAQKTLEAAGVESGSQGRPGDDDEIDHSPYADLNGRELKSIAKERGVDISGMKTVGEVRRALEEEDAKSEGPEGTANEADPKKA